MKASYIARAAALARRQPEYIVLVSVESTQGAHWWHLRADGTRGCVASAAGRPTRREHAVILDGMTVKQKAATHVVYYTGSADRPMRIAL